MPVRPALSPDTPLNLIQAALPLFARHGPDAVSTRQVAAGAGAPMSAITYHFGGKDGLYLACAAHIAERMRAQLGPAIALSKAACDETGGPPEAREALVAIFDQAAAVMIQQESADWARFIVREQMEPTAAFEALFEGVMDPLSSRIIELLIRASSDSLTLAEARVRAIALMGQVLVFRVARATALRVNHWNEIGRPEAAAIRTAVRSHLDAILSALPASTRP